MAKQTINNGETGSSVRTKLNENFTELYDDVDKVPYTGAAADLDLGVYDVIANSGTFGFGEVGAYSLNCQIYGSVSRANDGACAWLSSNTYGAWLAGTQYFGDYILAIYSPVYAELFTLTQTGNGSFVGTVKAGPKTVATLPSAGSSEGQRTYVTDANAAMSGNFGAIVAGGGSNKVPVFCDGTNWRIG